MDESVWARAAVDIGDAPPKPEKPRGWPIIYTPDKGWRYAHRAHLSPSTARGRLQYLLRLRSRLLARGDDVSADVATEIVLLTVWCKRRQVVVPEWEGE
jgi:hypothetical protein